MKQPLIGVTPLYDDERESIWMLPGYMNVLSACGATPIILPFTQEEAVLEQLTALCDGILFTGGHDVAPQLYGESPIAACGPSSPQRDALEAALFRLAAEAQLPVFGICRGIQFFNVMLGGTLYQDLPSQRPEGGSHVMVPPYDRPWHSVTLPAATPLASLLGRETLSVNSYHHQAIKQLAPGLRSMAFSADGLVEGVYAPGQRFLQAVQWHPEFSWQAAPEQQRIMQRFVDACRRH